MEQLCGPPFHAPQQLHPVGSGIASKGLCRPFREARRYFQLAVFAIAQFSWKPVRLMSTARPFTRSATSSGFVRSPSFSQTVRLHRHQQTRMRFTSLGKRLCQRTDQRIPRRMRHCSCSHRSAFLGPSGCGTGTWPRLLPSLCWLAGLPTATVTQVCYWDL